MKPVQTILSIIVLCAGLAGWETWRVGFQRTHLAALAFESGRMRSELKRLEGDRAPGLADLLPYVQSPGLREITHGMAGYMATHGGRQTTDAADLLPYLSTEEARTLAARIWSKRN